MNKYIIKFTIKANEKENIISNFKYFPEWFAEKYLKNKYEYSESRYETWGFCYNPFTNCAIDYCCLPPSTNEVYKWKVMIISNNFDKEKFKKILETFVTDYNKNISDENKIRIIRFGIHEMISFNKTKFIESVKLDF